MTIVNITTRCRRNTNRLLDTMFWYLHVTVPLSYFHLLHFNFSAHAGPSILSTTHEHSTACRLSRRKPLLPAFNGNPVVAAMKSVLQCTNRLRQDADYINHGRHSWRSTAIGLLPRGTSIFSPQSMITTSFIRSFRRPAFRTLISNHSCRLLSYSVPRRGKDHRMSSEPPKHEMVHFPNMTAALPSKSGEFRRVLWTGLYSQVVLMTVPVDGDIGDEVCCVPYEMRPLSSWI